MNQLTASSKRVMFDRVVKELNLDVRDPFTLVFANACALADLCDELRQRLAVSESEASIEVVAAKLGVRGC